jgi:pentose-5-phosphate-3-epimerase
MATVVPTVLATTPDEYAAMIKTARSLSARVHVDLCDGRFADATTIGLAQVHVPDGTLLDLHLMLKDPAAQLETALSLHPNLIIFHAESDGDVMGYLRHARELGIKAGIALLQPTSAEDARAFLEVADHALIFTGTLGHNAGAFQAEQVVKASEIRKVNSAIEISVDGGVTDVNARSVVAQGVDVLDVGAFLQRAPDPKAAYAAITSQTVPAQ